MKTIVFLNLFIMVIFLGCEDRIYQPDMMPPAAPRNLYAEAGDNLVELFWTQNSERDVAGYRVYAHSSNSKRVQYIGSTNTNHFIDRGIENGVTYYYAVTAHDINGNENEMSREYIYATPRPEGRDVILKDFRRYPNLSGYDFSTYSVGRYNDDYTDFFFEYYNGVYYLNVWDDTEIQGMGYTRSLYDIIESPTTGWSPTKDAQAIAGHTYVIRTWDSHYAKVRITSLTSTRIVFDWAYQLQAHNPFLKIDKSKERKPLTRNFSSRG
ncbi:MAG: hypothetical protein QME52_05935 [Bacteroidota bacterium]|nr:hypothetical protein [Bacteroidota bacterium]